DDAKVAVLDSMRHAVQAENDSASGHSLGVMGTPAPPLSAHRTDSTRTKPAEVDPLLNFASIDKIADYRAPFLRGALLADLDGNVWVRTTIVGRSGWGAVYDVIASNGQLVDRLQLPAGRRVVGFGRHGIVALAAGDAGSPEWLERMRWTAPSK
ncbi:MAG TPA: hypothetical protein VHZ95_01825, partial [Polyangiales bacterium]|nr:hypothetical protein [Polyangiales bacterium]